MTQIGPLITGKLISQTGRVQGCRVSVIQCQPVLSVFTDGNCSPHIAVHQITGLKIEHLCGVNAQFIDAIGCVYIIRQFDCQCSRRKDSDCTRGPWAIPGRDHVVSSGIPTDFTQNGIKVCISRVGRKTTSESTTSNSGNSREGRC